MYVRWMSEPLLDVATLKKGREAVEEFLEAERVAELPDRLEGVPGQSGAQ